MHEHDHGHRHTYTLAGAQVGFQTFSTGIGNGNTAPYLSVMGANWEVGVGTVAAGTLARTSVVASSNGNNPVNWGVGTEQIACSPYAAVTPMLTLASVAREPDRSGGRSGHRPRGSHGWQLHAEALRSVRRTRPAEVTSIATGSSGSTPTVSILSETIPSPPTGW